MPPLSSALYGFEMKKLIEDVVFAGRLFFKTLDLLDLLALFALAVMVLVAIPYGIIKLAVERGQTISGTVVSICLFISAMALIIHLRNRRKRRA